MLIVPLERHQIAFRYAPDRQRYKLKKMPGGVLLSSSMQLGVLKSGVFAA